MKILVLTRNTLSQRYLIFRISQDFDIVGVVFEQGLSQKQNFYRRLKKYGKPWPILWQAFWYLMIRDSRIEQENIENDLFASNGKLYPLPEGVPVITVENINMHISKEFIRGKGADLIAVSGTNLLRSPILSLYPEWCHKGIVNMHTGLSPYIRGGAATFWALSSGLPEHVGCTIHFIDPGIDSGNIILSGRPEISPEDTEVSLDAKVRKFGIDLYLKALKEIETGNNKSVQQWKGGQLFSSKRGYVQTSYLIYRLRKKLRRERVIETYLAHKDVRDKGVVIVT